MYTATMHLLFEYLKFGNVFRKIFEKSYLAHPDLVVFFRLFLLKKCYSADMSLIRQIQEIKTIWYPAFWALLSQLLGTCLEDMKDR